MNATTVNKPTIRDAEALLLYHFRTEPFHNLHLLFNNGEPLDIPGGTCSDKTLSFLNDARKMRFDAYLHTAFIGGQEIHRLVRMHIDKQIYFADAGNGWPAIKLFPAHEPISFRCFGMSYRTEILNGRIAVYHEKEGKESLQMEIDPAPRPEEEILAEIAARYTSGIRYPFSDSMRFSMIRNEQFLFLRGDTLLIYSKAFKRKIPYSSILGLNQFIEHHFGVSLSQYGKRSECSTEIMTEFNL